MKKYFILFILILSALMIELSSCNKDVKLKSPTSSIDGKALLAIVNASPNFGTLYGYSDSFNVFINGKKVSGFTPGSKPPALSFGTSFPNVNTGYGYMAVDPGNTQIKFSISGINNLDSVPIVTFNKTLQAGKQYSFIITDNVQSTRDSSQIFVEDVYTLPPTDGYYNVRFVDAVVNDTAMVDLFSYNKNAVVFTKVAPGGLTAFTQLGVNVQTTDTLYVTRSLPLGAPVSTPLASRTILAKIAFQGGNQKSYTVFFKGDFSITSTTNTKYRSLSFYRHE